jgi:hypothetical protein
MALFSFSEKQSQNKVLVPKTKKKRIVRETSRHFVEVYVVLKFYQ